MGILQDVFYGANRPMYLNYGAIGSIVGHEITHGFCEFGSAYDKYGRKHVMWTNQTLEAYKEKTRCIVEEADAFNHFNTNNESQVSAYTIGLTI